VLGPAHSERGTVRWPGDGEPCGRTGEMQRRLFKGGDGGVGIDKWSRGPFIGAHSREGWQPAALACGHAIVLQHTGTCGALRKGEVVAGERVSGLDVKGHVG
jgi:hypothetical protein